MAAAARSAWRLGPASPPRCSWSRRRGGGRPRAPFGVDLVYGAASKRAAVGTFGNTNACAAFLAPLLPLARGGGGARRGAAGSRPARSCVTAARCWSRARAAAGSPPPSGVARRLASSRWRAGAPLLLPAVALVGGLALGFAAQQSAASAPELASKPLGLGLERTSNVVRLDVARVTAALASHHLLLGVGPGGFRDAYFEHRPEREARTPTRGGYASDVDHPHCEPLRQLAEGGGIGLLVFLLALLATGRALLAARGAAREDDGRLRAGLSARSPRGS